ncbi:hypothetical protein Caka_2958 [Coraliomargarita akajimensis DSM 45221]|uniref:Uncharacterized protein n=1 Tax=Coraliomargarita akajimensis (strain DSM 45221 / IAM 15411 / JCM 23193 / KCTC 12865 / 04OKA010-24) TaxID=583355 RepID=D5ERC7_CORAD|nr:hypothetical protein Caka_2958 [Coraliomargarita akajimensis DSM 45221]
MAARMKREASIPLSPHRSTKDLPPYGNSPNDRKFLTLKSFDLLIFNDFSY